MKPQAKQAPDTRGGITKRMASTHAQGTTNIQLLQIGDTTSHGCSSSNISLALC